MTAPKGAAPESAARDPGAEKNAGSGRIRFSNPQPQAPQVAPKSWRNVLPIRPAADLLPRVSADELRMLGDANAPLVRVYLLTPRPSMPPGQVIAASEKPSGVFQDFVWLVFERIHVGPADLRWLYRGPRRSAP